MRQEFAPEDWTIPLRTVGLHEYSNAILEFEDLARISSPEQIEVFNEIIVEQPEYAFFSVSNLDEPSEANSDSIADKKKTEPNGKRHTLQWMLALARVEVGAGVAMYGHVGSAFELMRPNSFAVEEYTKLVAADAEAHWKALHADQDFLRKVKKTESIDSDTIAYMRRLKVVNDLVEYTKNNNERVEVGYAADEMLLGLRKAMKELESHASAATFNLAFQSQTVETDTNSFNLQSHSYGNDVVSLSPITRNCQRLFLNRHGGGSR